MKPRSAPPIWLVKFMIGLHAALYRASGGAIGGSLGKAPVALVVVAGRKSGRPLTSPLIYLKTDRGYAVIASFGGAADHPAWYLNLKAAGKARMQIARRRFDVRVEEPPVDSERYRSIWRDAAAAYPPYNAYRAEPSAASRWSNCCRHKRRQGAVSKSPQMASSPA